MLPSARPPAAAAEWGEGLRLQTSGPPGAAPQAHELSPHKRLAKRPAHLLRPSESLSPRGARSGKLRPPPRPPGASGPFPPLSLVGLTQEAGQAEGRSPRPSRRWVRLGRVTETLHDHDSKLGPLSRGPLSCLGRKGHVSGERLDRDLGLEKTVGSFPDETDVGAAPNVLVC